MEIYLPLTFPDIILCIDVVHFADISSRANKNLKSIFNHLSNCHCRGAKEVRRRTRVCLLLLKSQTSRSNMVKVGDL